MITEEKIVEILEQFEQQDYKRGGVSIDPSNYNAIARTVVKNCSIPDVTASAFVDKIAPMAEYIQGKHYKHEYKKRMIQVIEYKELREAAKQFDKEH